MKFYSPLILSIFLFGCANKSQVSTELREYQIPENWQSNVNTGSAQDNWIEDFNIPLLKSLSMEAIKSNQAQQQAAYKVAIAQQQVIQTGANFLPDLDLSLTSNRAKSAIGGDISNRNTLKLESSYEVDMWGKLSDNQQASQLNLLAAQAEYQQNTQNLVSRVVIAWFNLISANKLSILFEQRVNNAKQSLDIIESGYQQGVNKALDVYLSRNELNSETSNLANQKANLIESARALEQLLGRYPSGNIINQIDEQNLPLLTKQIPIGLPSDIISRKPELNAQWYKVLAQDATLAFTHKQRFPSLRLTASLSNSTEELSDLLSTSSIAWSILGGLTAPIFNAGTLRSNEKIAELRLKQQEQTYLSTLYDAFTEVENAITNEASLHVRYQATLSAQKNALAAETLAFEQYQRGLVNYTTVLNAQGRAFNAQSSLIQITNQLLANRVNLHLALGGDFSNKNNITDNNSQDGSTDE